MLRLLLLATFVVVSSASRIEGRSPRADYIEELLQSGAADRFPSDIIEDAMLDAPGLVQKYGYPFEAHTVVTVDGYILEIHRIPHGRDQNNTPDPNKPVVFLMHGLFSSSADYLVLGPGNALAYVLAEAGFDVWMGNARGNYYSRRHQTLDPDGGRGKLDYWMFSWDEIGCMDLPVVIDHIIATTGQPRMHYIGHSQGTTTFLILNSLRPEYNEKFISFHGLAPAAFFVHSEARLFQIAAPFEAVLERAFRALGISEFFGNRAFFVWFATNYCTEGSAYAELCSAIFIGDDHTYYNHTMTPLFFGHAPAGASTRQLAHFGQSINTKRFRRYNHLPIRNLELYGRMTPPEYEISKVTVPSYVYWGWGDQYADYRDVNLLGDRLPNLVGRIAVQRPSFNHLDFVWGVDAREQLYDILTENMLRYH